MKFFRKVFKIILAFLALMFLFPSLLYIPLIFNRNYYKEQVIKNVEKYSDYKLGLEKLELSVYPSIGICLKNLGLKKKGQDVLLLKLEEFNISIFVLGIFTGGKLQVNDLSFKNGFIDIKSILESIPNSEEETNEEWISKNVIDLLHRRLRIKELLLQNLVLKVKPLNSLIYHDPSIKELKITYESFLDSSLYLNADYGRTNIILKGIGGISPDQFDLQSLFYNADLIITNFPIFEYSMYLKDMSGLKLNGSKLNLKVNLKKEINSMFLENKIDFEINSIGYNKKQGIDKRIGPITLLGNIDYPLFSNKMIMKNLNLTLPNLFHLKIDSELIIADRPLIKANLSSSFVNVNPILDFVEALTTEDVEGNPDINNSKKKAYNIYLDLNYFIYRMSYEKHQVQNIYVNSILNNSALQYQFEIRNLFYGKWRLSGEANIQNGIATNAYLEIENLDMEKFTTQYFDKKLMEGTLSSYIKFQTDNIYGEKDFIKNLSLTGTAYLEKGILLDRADILYPIRFLNKIIPTKDKLNMNISKFNSIDIDFIIKNNRFKMKNFNMQGKVFNTTGTADIGFDNPNEDINANLIVSSRIAGAGIKIPMTYSKSSYVPFSIDTVWLASVYTGMVMGGPAGAMIGSLLSEKAEAAFKTIQNKSEETLKENTKKLFSK